MTLFLDILTKVTLPIIALIALGWLLQPRLKLDVGSLNRIQIYVVLPSFLVYFLATGRQPMSAIWPVLYMGLIQFMFLIPIGWLISILMRQRSSLGPIMGLGTAYANVGFFGIPLTQLAFGSEYVIYMSVMTALMSILVVTVGVWLLAPDRAGGLAKLKTVFETPMLPAVALGLGLRAFEVELPTVVSEPLRLMGAIFTPLALYTLGAQLSSTPVARFEWGPQGLIIVLKFLLAPAITWALCHYLEFPRDVTDVLVVAAATPVGVLIAVFAAEYKREQDFIAGAVVITTALSPIVVTAWILATRLL